MMAVSFVMAAGCTFLAAGVSKLMLPGSSVLAVENLGVLPSRLARILGALVPPIEVATGFALLTGWQLTSALMVGGVLAFLFMVGSVLAVVRRVRAPCYCFGKLSNETWGWGSFAHGLALALSLTLGRNAEPFVTVIGAAGGLAVTLVVLQAIALAQGFVLLRLTIQQLAADRWEGPS